MGGGEGQATRSRFDATTRGAMPEREVTHLHLLRHGEVESFGERRVRGQADVALSEVGHAQTRRLAEWVLANVPAPDALWTSDAERCSSLAARLADGWNLPATPSPELREQHMGEWQGRTWRELTEEDPDGMARHWADYADARAPGGESLNQAFARVRAWWHGVSREASDARFVVATHAGPIRAILCSLLDLPAESALRLAPPVASHTSITISPAGAVVETFGERPWTYGARS